jgi:serpin B
MNQGNRRLVLLLLATFCMLAIILACSDRGVSNDEKNDDDPHRRTPASLTESEKELLGATNEFGFEFFRQVIAAEDRDNNIFISPLSASVALGMAWNGAVGTTRTEMETTLGLAGINRQEANEAYQSVIKLLVGLDPDVTMTIANSIWAREGLPLKAEFIDLNQTYFDALVRVLDFSRDESADSINGWVYDNTGGKIPDIVSKPLPPDLLALLINAVYFKAAWTSKFDPDSTIAGEFHRHDGSVSECRFMRMHTGFDLYGNAYFDALNLPYGDSSFNMMLILPDSGVSEIDILNQFTAENWAQWTESFIRREGELLLPKFKFEYEINLNEVLKAMGIQTAFSDFADFSEMVEGGGVKIDEVKQKTFVQVDEEGTEAAAVTVISIGPTSISPNVFVFNRPFLFVIYERVSNTIIFAGRVAAPEFE